MLTFQFHTDSASSVFYTIKSLKRLQFFDFTGFLHRKTLGIIHHPKPPLQPYDAPFTVKNNHPVHVMKLLSRLLSDYRSKVQKIDLRPLGYLNIMQNHINFTTITLKGNFHALPRAEVFLTASLAGGEANVSLPWRTTNRVPYIGCSRLKGTDNCLKYD